MIVGGGKDTFRRDEFVEQRLTSAVGEMPADARNGGAVEWRIDTGADDERDDSRKSLSGIVGS